MIKTHCVGNKIFMEVKVLFGGGGLLSMFLLGGGPKHGLRTIKRNINYKASQQTHTLLLYSESILH